MQIKPFKAWRPEPAHAASTACPPYDVVTTEEARALAADEPRNFLHVTRAEIDLPEGTPAYADEVYARGAENLLRFRREGYLVQESRPSLYIYSQTMGAHTQTGLVTCCHAEDYDQDVIKKHEKTRKHTEDDRTRYIDTLSAHPGPVFLTYRDNVVVESLVANVRNNSAPLLECTSPGGVVHRAWHVADTQPYVDAFARIPCAYVADGHHRSAAASRVAALRRVSNPNHTGQETYNWFLAVLFPAGQLRILAYNRCVRDLCDRTPDQFLETLGERCYMDPVESGTPEHRHCVHMYLGGQWHRLTWKQTPSNDPVNGLDIAMLQDRVLGPMLDIEDPRCSERITFVGGIKGTEALESAVNSGEFAVAFSMHPVAVEDLMSVADAGKVMPPKSTWFEPKLCSGLFVHCLD